MGTKEEFALSASALYSRGSILYLVGERTGEAIPLAFCSSKMALIPLIDRLDRFAGEPYNMGTMMRIAEELKS